MRLTVSPAKKQSGCALNTLDTSDVPDLPFPINVMGVVMFLGVGILADLSGQKVNDLLCI